MDRIIRRQGVVGRMSSLDIWNNVREVPSEAKKEIIGGRMKGMTDINPVWRLKTLTEQFGPCGIGWRYEILDERLENGANGEIAAFVRINLYVHCTDLGWSDAIPGTGGNMFVASEKNGLRTSDECFKMALTDAISVACKALGVGASVYWDKEKTKYDDCDQQKDIKKEIGEMLMELSGGNKDKASDLLRHYTSFTGRDGNTVPGKSSIKDLTEKMMLPTYGKIKAEYLKIKKKEEGAVCKLQT